MAFKLALRNVLSDVVVLAMLKGKGEELARLTRGYILQSMYDKYNAGRKNTCSALRDWTQVYVQLCKVATSEQKIVLQQVNDGW